MKWSVSRLHTFPCSLNLGSARPRMSSNSASERGAAAPMAAIVAPKSACPAPNLLYAAPKLPCLVAGFGGCFKTNSAPKPLTFRGRKTGNPAPMAVWTPWGPPLFLHTSQSALSAEESYQIVLSCFPRGAGTKGLETRHAFDMRLAQGWTPEAIVAGARRYCSLETVPSGRSAKWTYPLRWLLDDDHFKAMCPRTECVPMADSGSFKAFFAYDAMSGRIPCVQKPGKSPVVVTFPVPSGINNDQLEEWLKRERAEEVAMLLGTGH